MIHYQGLTVYPYSFPPEKGLQTFLYVGLIQDKNFSSKLNFKKIEQNFTGDYKLMCYIYY